MTILGRATSSNVQALMWCVGELGLDYKRHDVGHRYGGTDTDAFYALNPNKTIPVLIDGDNPPLWETGAILRYLSSRYGPGCGPDRGTHAISDGFWPKELLARANVDRWAEWAKISVSQRFNVPVFWGVVRTPSDKKDPAAVRQAIGSLAERLRIAEIQLQNHNYLAGADFSLADIQFGHILFRYYDIDIERPELPNLQAYYHRLTKRTAFQKHVMVSYEELREL